MAERTRVYLHIGAPKTGTTYLQRVMGRNRDQLAADGVLYPHIRGDAHHSAIWDLRGKFRGSERGANFEGNWEQLLTAIRDWTGSAVVVSTEMLVYSDEEHALLTLESFGDAEVHVVYTARDLVRQVPAVWQEQVKNRRSMPYATYLDDLLGKRETRLARHFWRAQDAAEALTRWSQGIPPEHVHVVTAPLSGSAPDLLWQRFAAVIGVDPGAYPSKIPVANESLGVTAAEVLRRFNEQHGRMGILRYRAEVMRKLFPALLEAIPDRTRLPLPVKQRNRMVDLSEAIVARLRDAGYDVSGSLDELVPARARRKDKKDVGRGPDDLTESEVIVALVDVIDQLLGSPAVAQTEADAADFADVDEGYEPG